MCWHVLQVPFVSCVMSQCSSPRPAIITPSPLHSLSRRLCRGRTKLRPHRGPGGCAVFVSFFLFVKTKTCEHRSSDRVGNSSSSTLGDRGAGLTARGRASSFGQQPHQIAKHKSKTGFVGLKNMGCICYMNSTLQQVIENTSVRTPLLVPTS